jgi:membrane protease YdiL (CAAX protease family)
VIVFALVVAALSAALWLAILTWKIHHGGAVIPYERHNRVPWKVTDLAGVFVLYVVAGITVTLVENHFGLLKDLLPESEPASVRREDTVDAETSGEQEKLAASHPIVVLIHRTRDLRILLFCAMTAVVIAPITEEFLFRLLLQGWLEAQETSMRRAVPVLRRLVRGTVAVVPTSALFAAMHYRPQAPSMDPDRLIYVFAQSSVISLVTLTGAIALIRIGSGATITDLGFAANKFWHDVRLGFLAFLATVAPIYLLQISLKSLLPESPIVDPISLFFFALALGTLYYRTHRIVPAIVAHMALNAFSLLMSWLWVQGGVAA